MRTKMKDYSRVTSPVYKKIRMETEKGDSRKGSMQARDLYLNSVKE